VASYTAGAPIVLRRDDDDCEHLDPHHLVACPLSGKPDIELECAPGAGQVEVSDLTGCAGLSKDESHGQTTFPQH
jgi:hypothetical protein